MALSMGRSEKNALHDYCMLVTAHVTTNPPDQIVGAHPKPSQPPHTLLCLWQRLLGSQLTANSCAAGHTGSCCLFALTAVFGAAWH